jgi:hypothetical protein
MKMENDLFIRHETRKRKIKKIAHNNKEKLSRASYTSKMLLHRIMNGTLRKEQAPKEAFISAYYLLLKQTNKNP